MFECMLWQKEIYLNYNKLYKNIYLSMKNDNKLQTNFVLYSLLIIKI
jgi:hypothetical protein